MEFGWLRLKLRDLIDNLPLNYLDPFANKSTEVFTFLKYV